MNPQGVETELVSDEFLAELERCEKRAKRAHVRVAKYYPGKPLPQAPPGYRNVLIHVSNTGLGGALSPFVLRNEHGHLLENVWQFAKLYPSVSAQRTTMGKSSRVIWEHPAEVHVDPVSGEPTPAYWAWRAKGTANAFAVRYPNGFHGRNKCVCAIWNDMRLDYVEARKQIYCADYARLAPPTRSFRELKALLEQGTSLQIIEVDGPDPTLTHPPYDQISADHPGMLMSEETVRLLVNDTRKPFGHGFTIAALLLDGAEWMR